MRLFLILLLVFPLSVATGGCSVATAIGAEMVCEELRERDLPCPLDLSLSDVTDAALAGVELVLGGERGAPRGGRSALEDDPRVRAALADGSLPLRLTLPLRITNGSDEPLDLARVEWALSVDGREAARGTEEVARTVEAGTTATLPLGVEMDLVRVLGQRDGLVPQAERIARTGAGLRVEARLTARTPGGLVAYPQPLTATPPER